MLSNHTITRPHIVLFTSGNKGAPLYEMNPPRWFSGMLSDSAFVPLDAWVPLIVMPLTSALQPSAVPSSKSSHTSADGGQSAPDEPPPAPPVPVAPPLPPVPVTPPPALPPVPIVPALALPAVPIAPPVPVVLPSLEPTGPLPAGLHDARDRSSATTAAAWRDESIACGLKAG